MVLATCRHPWSFSPASRPPHVQDAAGGLSLICCSDVGSQREIGMLKGTPARGGSVAVTSCWLSAARPSLPLIQPQRMGPCLFVEKKLEDV